MYIIKSFKTDEIYIGYSSNLKKRLLAHNENRNASTRNRSWRLVYYEAYLDEHDARDREKKLKHYGKSLAMLKKRIEKSLSTKGAG